ncbi:MAG: methionyl-tRNA formyltransferase [Candidatus Lloydbacteria bacterium RIFCSPHIGHO2_01_FULL_41_20]|uniref:Methionyl-tRNA formyltransferase n=1 Tax=Candidatus Lloydbacteria bacterium RIFCSPHIGHO2_01_FULL_41_20 TaxID=1798657 RepID=A0A1G2CR96_9BACT|nr:MAG: methionyl-tRNA formyltransferase [Candidatus Lloydbacteria bacterium RIFCSPHIGHO2_01_FULL_41_20]
MESTSNGVRSNCKIAFFGTPNFAVVILKELKKKGIGPGLVITAPDKPRGRGMKLTPPPVKVWAEDNSIEYIQPEKLDSEFIEKLKIENYKLFVVAAYGKILRQEILDIPKYGTLNVHPSLLPKLRGASPIEGAVLEGEKETGVSIMILDSEMDHGPILAQEKIKLNGQEKAPELENKLAKIGGKLLAQTIPKWIKEDIKKIEQNHSLATFTKKITKDDGLIDPNGDSEINWRKFRAFYGWPGIYFFINGERIIVKDASLENGIFKIKRVLPEGRKEVDYEIFKKSI